ncbi:hypothetical protein HU200_001345 [Digitaria exilis]|uniref:BHLH domain-containing protein n=1 Tax=Digitaria exilis TaxID=1010633 RepID=A0A835FXN9_9POAL|nr:hypothetical protein HU200_001345 [Digitaria exilis]
MADEHFFPGAGDGDFPYGLAAVSFGASSAYAPPPGLHGVDAAMMMQGFGLPWPDLQLPDSSASATATAHFDSALSSLVSSPAAYAGAGDDDVAIGDLIGRLGSICAAATAAASATNSCYSTPLSSPPRGGAPSPASAAAAALAFHGGRLSRVASSKSLGAAAATTPSALGSPDEAGGAAVMRDDLAPPPVAKGGAARKRKASGKGKATTSAATAAANAASPPKRSKVAAEGEGEGAGSAPAAVAPETEAEAVKDYIHVRARRGQATDSHSLAERVRRERISERMKMLESLVPGCNKITGKALMLDEIINYVQSLQRQVEFLSMKLSTMNPEQLDAEARYQTAAAAMMAASSPPPGAAALSPYAGGLPAQQLLMDSCGWEAQDLQSVVARHNVHGHDLYASPSPPAHSSFHGKY